MLVARHVEQEESIASGVEIPPERGVDAFLVLVADVGQRRCRKTEGTIEMNRYDGRLRLRPCQRDPYRIVDADVEIWDAPVRRVWIRKRGQGEDASKGQHRDPVGSRAFFRRERTDKNALPRWTDDNVQILEGKACGFGRALGLSPAREDESGRGGKQPEDLDSSFELERLAVGLPRRIPAVAVHAAEDRQRIRAVSLAAK